MLRRDGDKLVAEMRGNLPALLGMDDQSLYNVGAGSPVVALSNWPFGVLARILRPRLT